MGNRLAVYERISRPHDRAHRAIAPITPWLSLRAPLMTQRGDDYQYLRPAEMIMQTFAFGKIDMRLTECGGSIRKELCRVVRQRRMTMCSVIPTNVLLLAYQELGASTGTLMRSYDLVRYRRRSGYTGWLRWLVDHMNPRFLRSEPLLLESQRARRGVDPMRTHGS